MIRRALAALAALVLLAGCGGAGEEEGTATLWVTRDRGAEVLLDAKVDAGQTLMRALNSARFCSLRYTGAPWAVSFAIRVREKSPCNCPAGSRFKFMT